jgi:hypothetical protein
VTDRQLLADVEHRFAFHPATEQTGPQHDAVRSAYRAMARYLVEAIPGGRHQSLALTSLQESMMWANAAIACDTVQDQPPVKPGKGSAIRPPDAPRL